VIDSSGLSLDFVGTEDNDGAGLVLGLLGTDDESDGTGLEGRLPILILFEGVPLSFAGIDEVKDGVGFASKPANGSSTMLRIP
jgi:hypothetical protein